MAVLPHLIKLPGTAQNPMFFVNVPPNSSIKTPTGLPTLKIMLPTMTDFKTREYLPIKPFNINLLKQPEGLSWITVKSLSPPNILVHLLSPDKTRPFVKLDCFFLWSTNMHPHQLIIPASLDNSPRKRTWDLRTGKSSLYNQPIFEPTDVDIPIEDTTVVPLRQAYTIDLSSGFLENKTRLLAILEKGRTTPSTDPLWQNLYIRFQGQKLKKYYVLRQHPSLQGITINYNDHSLYFTPIRPLSGPSLRFMYKQLSNFRSPYDWIPIIDNDFHFLTKHIPLSNHSKLKNLL